MTMILPPETAADATKPPDVRALYYALGRMHPALYAAPMLPGESFEDAHARRAAAADIFDHELAGYDPDADDLDGPDAFAFSVSFDELADEVTAR